MKRLALLSLALLALLAPASRAAAQGNVCELVYARAFTAIGTEGTRVVNAQGPLLVRCNNGEELRSDSAVVYQAQNEVHLFRQVDYQDPGRSLTSDNAIYNSSTGRLFATGNVVFTDKQQGSTLRGPQLEYYRAMAGRPQSQATATQRPHVTITPKNNNGTRRRQPMEIDADQVTSVGDRHMTATGNVVIVDNDTRSTAEEAYYDQVADHVELRRRAQVTSKDYQLSGNFISSDLRNGSISKVLAQTDARLVSERLTVTGPQLQLFFERDLLQRMISGRVTGPGAPVDTTSRSVALSKGFRLEADSIEALSPEQRLRQVNAVGKARGESWDTLGAVRVLVDTGAAAVRPDTATRVLTVAPDAIDQKDVLTADTIIAYFRTDSAGADSATGPRLAGRPVTAPRDTARGDTARTEIERLLAIGDAHSIYRTRPDSTKPANQQKPGINYLVGDRIDLRFKAGEVDVAHVRGLKQGLYLDPNQARDSAATDSAGARTAGRPAAGAGTGTARPAAAGGTTRAPATPAVAPPPASGTPRPAQPTPPVPTTPATRPLSLAPPLPDRGEMARAPRPLPGGGA